jgi:hypothetical protein
VRGVSRLLLGIPVLLAACVTWGPKFSDHPASTAAVPADTASLIVFWSIGSSYGGGAARGATILVDGIEAVSIPRGLFKALNVSPGTHLLAARYKAWSGLCETSFEASGGARYFVEVTPWVEPADKVAAWASAPLVVIPIFGQLIGAAAYETFESLQNTCGGFTVQLVDEATARPKLQEMWELR